MEHSDVTLRWLARRRVRAHPTRLATDARGLTVELRDNLRVLAQYRLAGNLTVRAVAVSILIRPAVSPIRVVDSAQTVGP